MGTFNNLLYCRDCVHRIAKGKGGAFDRCKKFTYMTRELRIKPDYCVFRNPSLNCIGYDERPVSQQNLWARVKAGLFDYFTEE